MSQWIDANARLPKIGEKVVCLYRIDDLDLYFVGWVESINTSEYARETVRNIEWMDEGHNHHIVEFWMELPASPYPELIEEPEASN